MRSMSRRTIILLIAFVILVAILATVVLAGQPSPTNADQARLDDSSFDEARAQMVQDGVVGWGIDDPVVIEAMATVPRHRFVPAEYLGQAYENHPLPIGYGQTISQPYIVALMTETLELEPGEKVLEIGTGSGYQAAILAEVGAEVYSIEIVGPLAETAKERLAELGYTAIQLRAGDGYDGWPEAAPFDAIIVTAAPDHVPQALLAQLAVNGVMVVPVGPPGGYQELWRLKRLSESEVESTSLGGVRFVPLVHEG